MKNQFFVFAILVLMVACQTEPQTAKPEETNQISANNDLLPNKVIVYNEVNYKKQDIEDWTKGVDQNYFETLNNKVLNSGVAMYSSSVFYDTKDAMPMTKADVLNNMVDQDSAGISALYFIESWDFNQADYRFVKTIEAWAPVYEFTKIEPEGNVKAKKLLYDIKARPQKAEKLIAENITYEVNFDSEFKNYEYLNTDKLAYLIVEPMLKGDVKAYDYFNNNLLSIDDMKRTLGYSADTLLVESLETGELETKVVLNEENISLVKAYIFVEDWYIDEQNFAIQKKIKAIAPVAISSNIDVDGELIISKKIVGLVKFNK
jgi:hypothetical protein